MPKIFMTQSMNIKKLRKIKPLLKLRTENSGEKLLNID
jgi:hypothetical protein